MLWSQYATVVGDLHNIPAPSLNIAEIHATCSRVVKKPEIRAALLAQSSAVAHANDQFVYAVQAGSVHELNRPTLSADIEKALIRNYESRMVPAKSAGRHYYDEIRLSAPNNICPLCLHGSVRALDHYLPKSRFPLLSVSAQNLVPICNDCNKIKLDDVPSTATDAPLHPYYDNLGSGIWLTAAWIARSSVVEFAVTPPIDWTPALAARVANHFAALELGDRFSEWAVQEVSVTQLQIRGNDRDAATLFLKSQVEVHGEALGANHWRTATSRAMYDAYRAGTLSVG